MGPSDHRTFQDAFRVCKVVQDLDCAGYDIRAKSEKLPLSLQAGQSFVDGRDAASGVELAGETIGLLEAPQRNQLIVDSHVRMTLQVEHSEPMRNMFVKDVDFELRNE